MAPPKGKKGQTMSLADFTKTFQAEVQPSTSTTSWADEEVELPTAPLGRDRSAYDRPGRVPASRRGREEAPLPVVIDQRALPREPPFMAFVGNLGHDVNEDDIRTFFSQTVIKGIRFPKGGDTSSRRFCYVEFHSVEGLTEGLLKSGQLIRGYPCRVDIAMSRREERDPRLTSGNWRDGHQIVERAATSSSQGDFRNPLTMANWRETAKPMDAVPFSTSTISKKEDNTITAQTFKSKKPELKLTPRTKPVVEGEQLALDEYKNSKKPNPFGDAKPREIVLAEKKDSDKKQVIFN